MLPSGGHVAGVYFHDPLENGKASSDVLMGREGTVQCQGVVPHNGALQSHLSSSVDSCGGVSRRSPEQ